MRVETATVVISLVCFFFSIYFAILSLQIIDMALRTQLMALATSFLVAGAVVLVCWITSFVLGRALFKS